MANRKSIVQNSGQSEQIQTGDYLDVGSTNADGAQITGGVIARILKWLGADITITGSSTNTQTMPSSSQTLVGRNSTDILTLKTITGLILNAGTTALAFLVSNAGSLLIATVQGAWEFDGILLYFTPGTIRRNIALKSYAFVSTFDFTTASTTPVDITGLSIALAANSTYDFEARLNTFSDTTAGNKYSAAFSAAGATMSFGIISTLAAGTADTDAIYASGTLSRVMSTSINDGTTWIKGRIIVGNNAGNLTIQIAKVTSGNAIARVNSSMSIEKVG